MYGAADVGAESHPPGEEEGLAIGVAGEALAVCGNSRVPRCKACIASARRRLKRSTTPLVWRRKDMVVPMDRFRVSGAVLVEGMSIRWAGRVGGLGAVL